MFVGLQFCNQVRRALSFLVQCGDGAPLLNIMGVFPKQDTGEKDKRMDFDHNQDGETDEKEEGQVEDPTFPSDDVQKPPRVTRVSPGQQTNNVWSKEMTSLQKQISEDLHPTEKAASFQGEKQRNSSLSFSEKTHSDILNKHIDNAINAVMGEKTTNKQKIFPGVSKEGRNSFISDPIITPIYPEDDNDGEALIEDVKLEQEESSLVEFFEDPEPENSPRRKFVKANRRVYTLEKGLLRANRRVYNLPAEVKEKMDIKYI